MLDITYENYLSNPDQILKQLGIHHITSFEKYLQLGPDNINTNINKLKNMTYHLRDIYLDQQNKNLEFSKELHKNYLNVKNGFLPESEIDILKSTTHEKNSGLLKILNSNRIEKVSPNIFVAPNPIIKRNSLVINHQLPLSMNQGTYFNKPPQTINFRDRIPPNANQYTNSYAEKGKLTFVSVKKLEEDRAETECETSKPITPVLFKSNSIRSFTDPIDQPVLKKAKLVNSAIPTQFK